MLVSLAPKKPDTLVAGRFEHYTGRGFDSRRVHLTSKFVLPGETEHRLVGGPSLHVAQAGVRFALLRQGMADHCPRVPLDEASRLSTE